MLSFPARLPGGGQARRPLRALGRGGAAVALRDMKLAAWGLAAARSAADWEEKVPLNNSAPSWPGLAERRVLDRQHKLHRWAKADPDRRFGDVFNLICDRATLVLAWERVSGNQGARTAGVDAVTRCRVEEDIGARPFWRNCAPA